MSMPKFIALILILLLVRPASSFSPAVTPYKSPELVISNPADPTGSTTLLSSLKGKVVVVEFMFIQSNHCVRVAKVLNQLNQELGPRGFQALGVAFDPPSVKEPSLGVMIQPAIQYFKLTYPIGYASKSAVDTYLDRPAKETLSIPQVVVIDRAGFIRAMSGPHTDPDLEQESSLRTLIDRLLKENAPPATHTKPSGKIKKT